MSEEKAQLEKFVEEKKDGVIITIYVKPGANREALVVEGGDLVFYTTEIPEKGRANAVLIRFLVKNLKVSSSKIDIVYGVRDRVKKVLIRDAKIEDIIDKLRMIISS